MILSAKPKISLAEYLSRDDCDRIHQASLQVLEKGGIKFESKAALDLLEEGGCRVDRSAQIARFPQSLVQDMLKKCPPTVTLYSREAKNNITLGTGEIYFGTSAGMDVVDLMNGEVRPGVLQDVTQAALLGDALDAVSNVLSCVSWAADVPFEVNSQAMYVEVFKNTTKTSLVAYITGAEHEVEDLVRICQIVAGGAEALKKRPFAFSFSGPIPPLDNSTLNCDAVFAFARAGLPIFVGSGISAGATGPATLAGTLVQLNAEFLSNVVFVQLINPGLGISYGHYNTIMDMRTGSYASGAIEYAMLGAAIAQLARYYRVPCSGFYPMSDSHALDQQVAYEKSLQWMLSVLGGMELTCGMGCVTDNRLFAHEQMVIDAEVCGMTARALRGITVSAATLATDLIIKVGPIPGNYLKEDHTLEWYRKESFMPRLSEKRSRDAWKAAGAKDVVARAREEARRLLASHQPAVPPELAKELDDYLASVKKRAQVAA